MYTQVETHCVKAGISKEIAAPAVALLLVRKRLRHGHHGA